VCIVLHNFNSYAFAPLIILDREARRLIKRQKLSHPRFGVQHGVGALSKGSKLGVASQHVDNAGRQQPGESLPSRMNYISDDKPRRTMITTTSGEVGKSRGSVRRSRLRPMVGLVGPGSEVNLGEVRSEISSPFLSWAENKSGSGDTCTSWWNRSS